MKPVMTGTSLAASIGSSSAAAWRRVSSISGTAAWNVSSVRTTRAASTACASTPLRADRGREQVDAHPLAQRADGVERPGDASPSTASASHNSDSSPRRAAIGSSTRWRSSPRNPSAVGRHLVLGADRGALLDDGQPFAPDRRVCAAEQQVGDAAHRRGHDGDLDALLPQSVDDLRGLAHRVGAADRRAAELQNDPLTHALSDECRRQVASGCVSCVGLRQVGSRSVRLFWLISFVRLIAQTRTRFNHEPSTNPTQPDEPQPT